MQENSIGVYGGKTFNEVVKDYRKINPNVPKMWKNKDALIDEIESIKL